MTTTNGLRRRVDSLTATLVAAPIPPAATAAYTTLRAATVELCAAAGGDREQWLHRCADECTTPSDLALLAAVPADALIAAGVSAIGYVSEVLRDF
jgi:hypothetical protein